MMLSHGIGSLTAILIFIEINGGHYPRAKEFFFLYAVASYVSIILGNVAIGRRASARQLAALSAALPYLGLYLAYVLQSAIHATKYLNTVGWAFVFGLAYPYVVFHGYAASLIAGLSTFLLLRYSGKPTE